MDDKELIDSVGDVAGGMAERVTGSPEIGCKCEAAVESVLYAGKRWFKSKTVWMNIIALGAIAYQYVYGGVVDIEAQAAMLAIVNVGLRFVTKEALV